MDKLTARQEEFLLFFASRDGNGNCVSEAADRFGVSKATVSVTCTALIRYDMIQKVNQGGFALTEAGWEYIDKKLRMAGSLAKYLTTRLGLAPYMAEMESRKMVVSLLPETTDAILKGWIRQEELEREAEEKARIGRLAELNSLACGLYALPFEVCKPEEAALSMGDRGFEKPAKLLRTANECLVLLHPAKFAYKPDHHKQMEGSLERLWYHADGAWKESAFSDEGDYEIPAESLRYLPEAEGKKGIVRIRARATVGLRKMPESEADLVFHFGEIGAADIPTDLPEEEPKES